MDTTRINKGLAASLALQPSLELPDHLLEHHPQQLREERRQQALREPQPVIPPGLHVENRMIPGLDGAPDIRLRIYHRQDIHDAPVMLYFHGGGFVFGTPEQVDFQLYALAMDTGYLIVSVDYRLAPEHPFPAAIEDGYAALLWLCRNAAGLPADTRRIMVAGASAGGALATGIARMSRDQQGPAVGFQLLIYPVADHTLDYPSVEEFADAPLWTRSNAAICWKHYLGHQPGPVSPYASPLSATEFADLPKTFMLVCGLDTLRDEGIRYAQQLMQAGVPVELQVWPDAVHVFDLFPCELTNRFYATLVRVMQEAWQ